MKLTYIVSSKMHVYSQDGYSFYKSMTGTSGIIYRTFYDHDTNVRMKVKQSQNDTIVIWSWVAENGFLMDFLKFPMKWLLCIKNFFVSKKDD